MWFTPVIPARGQQRQKDACESRPGLHSKFQGSQSYIVRHLSQKKKKKELGVVVTDDSIHQTGDVEAR